MENQTTQPLRGAIVAMTADNIIGLAGKIPWHYSGDLKRFKQRTMGATIVMGRLTWESIGSKPLPGRRNIVVSRNPVQDIESYTSIESALDQCHSTDTWILGGGQIYQATMDWLNLLDVTYVPDVIDDPDAVRFPPIDLDLWVESESSMIEDGKLKNILYHRRID